MVKPVNVQINSFIRENKALCICTLGLAIVGYSLYALGGRVVAWIKECAGTTKKVDTVGEKKLKQTGVDKNSQEGPSKVKNSKIQPKPKDPSVPVKVNKPEQTSAPLEVVSAAPYSVGRVLHGEPFDETILEKVSSFNGYVLPLPEDHACHGVVLTGLYHRPATLFFDALFEGTDFRFTRPGESLFQFYSEKDAKKSDLPLLQQKIRKHIDVKAAQLESVSFTAKGVASKTKVKAVVHQVNDLSDILGNETYKISYKEIQETLESQKIYTSSLLPKAFYQGFKDALLKDGHVELPGEHGSSPTLKSIKEKAVYKTPHCQKFLNQVAADLQKFGFKSNEGFNAFMELTLFQMGSMVVKTEDYRIFMDGKGKIIKREEGQKDQILLINACGLRPSSNKVTDVNRQIMKETFKTALISAESGISIFPAVGMGIWGGDPDLYWRAFLDAVLASSDHLEQIVIHPGHRPSPYETKYPGKKGEEFEEIVAEYRTRLQGKPEELKKLDKLRNLYDKNPDVLQLARELKLANPDKVISVFNASDPDVTLGNHVGEYTNNWPHATTTEENYTAMGTNGICFEGITGIHNNPSRIIQT